MYIQFYLHEVTMRMYNECLYPLNGDTRHQEYNTQPSDPGHALNLEHVCSLFGPHLK